jgi:hypothetical protein
VQKRLRERVWAAANVQLPQTVKKVFARTDWGFWKAVKAHESLSCQFIVVARKTARLVDRARPIDFWRCIIKSAGDESTGTVPVVRNGRPPWLNLSVE